MKKILLPIFIAFAFVVIAGYVAKLHGKTDWYGYQTFAFNTECELFFYGREADCDDLARRCLNEILKIDRALNRFSLDSAVSKFNQQPANQPFVCGKYLGSAFHASAKAYEKTDGAFDVTIGPLMDFWRHQAGDALTATDCEELGKIKACVGFNNLTFTYAHDDAMHAFPTSVVKNEAEMRVDFGGIAKGLALDIIAQRVKKEFTTGDIKAAFLDFGGNFVYLGDESIALFSDAAIANPTASLNAVAENYDEEADADNKPIIGKIHDWHGRYISTSSNAYRPLGTQANGQPISHIIEPMTGQPVAHFASVTAIANTGAESDAFSTAVLARGRALAEELVRRYPGTAFVLKNGDDDVITLGPVEFTPE